ncbi:uncharacterized protein LOC106140630 [Amyelois transitella]|uniref:uncharacterized protein LOC106140630 n=1 Tax=Amyelois transitella TaxID=680683 RepID=UPI0029902316|nr:uncharacterized protein LOC106140630 [Amyelois transitella]
MGPDNFSDYGSGSSTNSAKSWHTSSKDPWPQFKSELERTRRSSSFLDLVMNQCTLQDALEEFRQNGSDSPYTPEEERNNRHADHLVGMGPSSQYLRQKSWPQPERSPAPRLPREWSRAVEDCMPRVITSQGLEQKSWLQPEHTSAPRIPQDWSRAVEDLISPEVPMEVSPPQFVNNQDTISQEQLRLLSTLPNDVLYALLRELEGQGLDRKVKRRQNEIHQECRFCKNNGERESYYRSHPLKSGGRVACPVLRAFVCRRCGASGDAAHTAKYCPLATNEERKKSAAMMRSVRLASGRRRASPATELLRFGAPSQAVLEDNKTYASFLDTPLDPLWAALEQKLML